jgi:uncharacterized protein
MIHPDTELRFKNPDVGYGVFATRFIPRGTIVWTLCDFDIRIPPSAVESYAPAYRSIVDRYAYVDAEGGRILCWDHARYINHSCDPAMLSAGPDIEIAVRDLHPGDEFTCEYGTLNLVEPLQCQCGASTCRGSICVEDVLQLWPALDESARRALAHASAIAQPLMPFVRDTPSFAAWLAGTEPLPSSRTLYAPK